MRRFLCGITLLLSLANALSIKSDNLDAIDSNSTFVGHHAHKNKHAAWRKTAYHTGLMRSGFRMLGTGQVNSWSLQGQVTIPLTAPWAIDITVAVSGEKSPTQNELSFTTAINTFAYAGLGSFAKVGFEAVGQLQIVCGTPAPADPSQPPASQWVAQCVWAWLKTFGTTDAKVKKLVALSAAQKKSWVEGQAAIKGYFETGAGKGKSVAEQQQMSAERTVFELESRELNFLMAVEANYKAFRRANPGADPVGISAADRLEWTAIDAWAANFLSADRATELQAMAVHWYEKKKNKDFDGFWANLHCSNDNNLNTMEKSVDAVMCRMVKAGFFLADVEVTQFSHILSAFAKLYPLLFGTQQNFESFAEICNDAADVRVAKLMGNFNYLAYDPESVVAKIKEMTSVPEPSGYMVKEVSFTGSVGFKIGISAGRLGASFAAKVQYSKKWERKSTGVLEASAGTWRWGIEATLDPVFGAALNLAGTALKAADYRLCLPLTASTFNTAVLTTAPFKTAMSAARTAIVNAVDWTVPGDTKSAKNAGAFSAALKFIQWCAKDPNLHKALELAGVSATSLANIYSAEFTTIAEIGGVIAELKTAALPDGAVWGSVSNYVCMQATLTKEEGEDHTIGIQFQRKAVMSGVGVVGWEFTQGTGYNQAG